MSAARAKDEGQRAKREVRAARRAEVCFLKDALKMTTCLKITQRKMLLLYPRKWYSRKVEHFRKILVLF